jgi:hypothetical protein
MHSQMAGARERGIFFLLLEPIRPEYGFVHIEGERWTAMNFIGANAYQARAIYCSKQAELSNDVKFKKFWDDLADDWLTLYKRSLVEKDETPKL